MYAFSITLAIYTRSPAAYKAFSSFGLFQLLSVSTKKTYTRSNVEAAGDVEHQLVDECCKYDARVMQSQSAGCPHPPPPCAKEHLFLMKLR